MNLMVFFDRCQIRDWEGAWSLIDEIGLFPSEEETMSRNVANYQALDTALKGKPFRRAVLYTMESLYQQHSALKGRLGGSQSSQEAGTINQRLGDLRRRARLLVTLLDCVVSMVMFLRRLLEWRHTWSKIRTSLILIKTKATVYISKHPHAFIYLETGSNTYVAG